MKKIDDKTKALLLMLVLIIAIFCVFMYGIHQINVYRAQKIQLTQQDSVQTNAEFEDTWGKAFNEEDL